MTKIIALMTCFNRKQKTVKAIYSLVNKNPNIEFVFIIVDDNSTDGTKELLKNMRETTVIDGSGNLYYCGGMRLAISKALKESNKADYCLLFNDDVDFFDGAIDRMILEAKEADIVVGATCDNNGMVTYGGVIKTSQIRPKFKIIDGNSSRANRCDTFNANCVLIPWKVFKCLGNYDSVYTHSLGDFDYGLSASRRGYRISVCKSHVGICYNNSTENTWKDTRLKIKERVKKKETPKGLPKKEWFYFLNKNYNVITAVVYSIIPYVRIILKH